MEGSTRSETRITRQRYEDIMKYDATLESGEDGDYIANCEELGVSAHGLSRSSAIEALRGEIRYRIELCPCSSVEDDWVEVEVK
jgi:hypothetical protein